jgi:4-amino-4-deoxy-L-arabinose transferase-like glycosyltransferase
MTTVAEPQRRSLAWNKIAAGVAWLGGVFTTWLFFTVAAPTLPPYIALAAAALVQWVLTIAERPLWRVLLRRSGGRLVILGLVVTLIDGLINAGGIYPHVGRLAQTDVGKMIAEVLRVQQTMDSRSSFLLALAIGLVVAGLPEYLWEAGTERR